MTEINIPEVQNKMEQSLMMSPQVSQQIKPQAFQSKDLARQVDHFIARLPSQFNQVQVKTEDNGQKVNNQHENIANKSNERSFLSQYNYTGKAYRFEVAEKEAEVSKPDPQPNQRTKTQLERDRNKQQRYSNPRDIDSVKGQQSFDDSDVNFPSHNYYIMFDRKQGKKKKKNQKQVLSKTVCLESKVKRLEAEVKMLRQYGFASANGSFKKDKKMKLDQLINSMLE